MRHRSLTNSRHYENLELRFQYRMDNPECELHTWFPKQFKEPDACDIHHLFSCHVRYDLITNMLAVNRESHRWLEEHKTAGRIAAVWIKHCKGELDLVEFKLVSGRHLRGWLVVVDTDLDFLQEPLAKLRKAYP